MPMNFGGGGNKCGTCGKSVYKEEEIVFEGIKYHNNGCFVCSVCNEKIPSTSKAGSMHGKVAHRLCFEKQMRESGGHYGGEKVVAGALSGGAKVAAVPIVRKPAVNAAPVVRKPAVSASPIAENLPGKGGFSFKDKSGGGAAASATSATSTTSTTSATSAAATLPGKGGFSFSPKEHPASAASRARGSSSAASSSSSSFKPAASKPASAKLASFKTGAGVNKCGTCGKSVYKEEEIVFEGIKYHNNGCFLCSICKEPISSTSKAGSMHGKVAHRLCFEKQMRESGGHYGGEKVVAGSLTK